jgi:hypothetical protein
MLCDLYHTQHLSLQTIAEKLKTNKYTLLHRMDMNNIPRRSRGGANNKSNKRILLHMLDQRFVRCSPVNEVAKLINSHPSTVWKFTRGEKE